MRDKRPLGERQEGRKEGRKEGREEEKGKQSCSAAKFEI
jgi:hypothetical protein